MIFVDTSFWVAQAMSRDGRHDEARALTEQHGDAGLITTNLVCGETWTFLRRRDGHPTAVRFLDLAARSPRVREVRVTEAQEDGAWGWLRRHDERAYSFVDATSFQVMRSLRIREALAFDGDFAAAGFVELRP